MTKTAQELKEKSEKTLKDPKLVEIVNDTPANRDGRVNLTRAYENSFAYILKETKDLKKAKEFAVAARWLAMLKRDYLEEFEAFVANTKNGQAPVLAFGIKPETSDVEIELFGDVIFPSRGSSMGTHGIHIRISREDLIYNGIKMAADLLEAITGVYPSLREDEQFPGIKVSFSSGAGGHNDKYSETKRLSVLRDYLTQILEEKFGIKIKEN